MFRSKIGLEPGTPKVFELVGRLATKDTKDNKPVSPIKIPLTKDQQEDLSEYTLTKFAATYFSGNQSCQFSKKQLKTSLIDLPLPSDQIAAQAIWVTILRFMGDMAEAKYDTDYGKKRTSVMQNLNATISKSFQKSKELNKVIHQSDHQKLIQKTLKRKTKLPEELRNLNDTSEDIAYYQNWLSTRSSNLDKLHFIIGHGILRSELRDEIFCQICKQLSNNPYHISYAKGWILLSLCIGCFPPSQRFKQYLRAFIRNGPELYAPYCERRLDRTLKNGLRTQPPSWLELHATRTKNPIYLSITLMDGSSHQIEVDSASTANEICLQLGATIGIQDIFGFSIFIKLFEKVMSLGSAREHIMDAISNCEQYVKEQGGNERHAPWKLFFRKEFFSPWYNPSGDSIATNLIYRQVVRGINFGEYRCKTDKDIAILGALQYYAEYGATMDPNVLRKVLSDYIPKDLVEGNITLEEKWFKLIQETFKNNKYVQQQEPTILAKEDIVVFAQLNWPMMFSRFYEAVKTSGPDLSTNNIIIAVNWSGLFLISESEDILMEFTFVEILSIKREENDESNIDDLQLNTIQNTDFIFKCYDASEVAELLNFILKEMRRKSMYAVAVQNYSHPENSESYLNLSKGDLITLEEGTNGEIVMSSNTTWARGECNGLIGSFPTEAVHILPAVHPPSKRILQLYKDGAVKGKKHAAPNYNTLQRKKMHTLRRYAAEHFRGAIEVPRHSTTMMSVRRANQIDLWRHTREPIKAPLLQRLQKQTDSFEQAVAIFTYILRYMGDLPKGRTNVNTDLIFEAALKDELLRDEVYCQIIKQLTDNRIQISEERGWELMWLATGIMAPSPGLVKELQDFLRSHSNPLAVESLKRVQRTLRLGQRKQPPYIIEVEAIRHRTMQIYHKIYFPDDTEEAFPIESSTKAKDLCETIANSLELKSHEGFSLFVCLISANKAFSVPEDQFIFDFIYELASWMKENIPSRTAEHQIQCNYQLFFMKKLWINNTPGRDKIADQMFYFPHEVQKYLNGYYKISKQEAIKFASLIYWIYYGENTIPLNQQVQGILPQLLPESVINLAKPDEWKKQILAAYNYKAGHDQEDAKTEFLKLLQENPTFGSTFFVVRQTNDNYYPEVILIAINRHGFHIIDPEKKNILKTFNFSELNFWSSGNTFFQIRFGNMMGASKLLCETTQGYKMDDLLSSYIRYMKTHNIK